MGNKAQQGHRAAEISPPLGRGAVASLETGLVSGRDLTCSIDGEQEQVCLLWARCQQSSSLFWDGHQWSSSFQMPTEQWPSRGRTPDTSRAAAFLGPDASRLAAFLRLDVSRAMAASSKSGALVPVQTLLPGLCTEITTV